MALAIGAFVALLPLWAPLLLAAFAAIVCQPLHTRLVGTNGRRGRAAGVITVVLVVLVLTPLSITALSLTGAAVELGHRLRGTGGASEALQAFLSAEPQLSPQKLDLRRAIDFVRSNGQGAINAFSMVFGAATAAIIGVFVFLFAFYTFLVEGRRAHEWILDHSPLRRPHTERLCAAFTETGRGLLVGVGLTALLQGFIATVGYVVIGVPQALVLGLLTGIAALIPSVGTGLVWVPVAVGLFIADRTSAGVALVVLGAIVSIVDNFLRPALSRYAKLDLPTFLVFAAMLGGIAAFGAWGLLAGPLLVRLSVEALRIHREEREPRWVV